MDHRMLFFGCLLLAFLGSVVEAKLITYCNSPDGVIKSVSISNCKNTDRFCIFKKHTNVSLEVNFVPSYAATSVTVKVIGEVAGVPVPFPVDPNEACGNYGLTCPLPTGQPNKFQLALPIKALYPPIMVGVTIKLVDDSKKNLACFKFSAKITE